MYSKFYAETDGIYRLKIPFEKIFTSVFLIESNSGKILVDTGTTQDDVELYIIPALSAYGCRVSDIRTLVLTHKHSDHAGGSKHFLRFAPDVEVITDIKDLGDGITIYPLSGHTDDSIGVLDERSGTLISADGLQGAGVDRYRCSIKNMPAYLATIERIRNDKRIENILFSHAYEPWNKDNIFGRENVKSCVKVCESIVRRQARM
ncbi:MAG: MBL fold metallo-hydrolase [Ruminococcaceae bacterium]|nr:MBL fold metallo-hydrolase [Oscillospiraceae bacterium]